MLRISNHAVYRYAKRVFYQDVSDKKRDLDPKLYYTVRNHALQAVKDLKIVGNGKYPVGNAGIKAVIKDNTVVTFLY